MRIGLTAVGLIFVSYESASYETKALRAMMRSFARDKSCACRRGWMRECVKRTFVLRRHICVLR